MDKLIKDIRNIVSRFSSPLKVSGASCVICSERDAYRFFGRDEVVDELVEVLASYTERHSHCFDSCNNEISSSQWDYINLLVDDARERWQLLPGEDVHFDDLSLLDAYRIGFVNAVLRMMAILHIDENRVKK